MQTVTTAEWTRSADEMLMPRAGDCPCSRRWQISDDEHAWLTTVETRGAAGVVELINEMENRAASDPEPGALSWMNFLDFVSMHNWHNAGSMIFLADIVVRVSRAATE